MKFTLEQVENGVTEALRKATVAMGYLPDVVPFISGNDVAGFEAAKAAIRTGGKDIIEVFGPGDSSSRDQITTNKIIVNRLMPQVGDIGMFGAPVFIPNGDPSDPATTYDKKQYPKYTEDIEFNIFIFTLKDSYDLILDKIIRNALQKTYLKGVNPDGSETSGVFNFLRMGNGIDMSNGDFIERMFRFVAKDILLDDSITVATDIKQMVAIVGEAYPTSEITEDSLDGNVDAIFPETDIVQVDDDGDTASADDDDDDLTLK